MAYLGRPGATAPLTSADIPDNSITAAKIVTDTIAAGDLAPNSVDSSELVDGGVDLSHMSANSVDSDQYVDGSIDTAHIGDDQVTGDKLANDIAISTTGAITTTGAFTSVGIDDNADATAITITSSENVGIGVVDPHTTLEVNGSISCGTDQATPVAALYVRTSHATEYAAHIENTHTEKGHGLHVASNGDEVDEYILKCTNGASATVLCATGNGNVGIGTASPGNSLQVTKSADGTDHSITIQNSYTADSSTDEKAGINFVVGNGQASVYSYKVSDTQTGANRDVGFQIWTQQNNAFSEKFRVSDSGDLTAVDTSIGSLSDERLKTNIEDYDYDLATFKALKPRIFDWKNPNEHCGETRRRGFVAQELKLVDDYWVNTHEAKPLVDQILDAETYYEEGDTLPEGKNIGDVKTETTYDYQYKKGDGSDYDLMDDGSDLDKTIITAKLGKKDTMYVSIIQQLITKIETLETKVTALENA